VARCRCAEGACGCSLVAGTNTTVDGEGTPKDPWVVSAGDHGYLAVADTATLDLQLLGDGTSANPHLLSGTVIGSGGSPTFVDTEEVAFTVSAATPPEVSALLPLLTLTGGIAGHVLTQDATGVFSPMPAATAPVGAVATGHGIKGDGSAVTPLRINLCSYDDLKAACAP